MDTLIVAVPKARRLTPVAKPDTDSVKKAAQKQDTDFKGKCNSGTGVKAKQQRLRLHPTCGYRIAKPFTFEIFGGAFRKLPQAQNDD